MTPELEPIIQIAKQAGNIVLKYFQQPLEVAYKQDQFDPVTQADREADGFIRAELMRLYPKDGILSEESQERPDPLADRVWMVDPLDGTKEFIDGLDGFAVMIGLLEHGVPQLGVVYAPARNLMVYAQREHGAYSGDGIRLQVNPAQGINQATLVTRNIRKGDVRPIEATIERLPFHARITEGSIGLKIALLAGGQADAFVHTNRKAGKWDTLAPQVVLTEAGGVIMDAAGLPLDYRQPSPQWDQYLVAAASGQLASQIVAGLAPAL